METFLNFIDGQWRKSVADTTFPDENPARRGSEVARFQLSDPSDMRAAVDAASAAFAGWRKVKISVRQEKAQRFLDLLAERSEELARVVSIENGKTIRESRAEVQSALLEGSHHVQQMSRFGGNTIPMGTADYNAWMQYDPLGVAGIISPWNFPVNVMCRKTLPALLTGNTVVFKPASYTPWSGVFMARLFEEAGFPAGVFNCVTGAGSAIGNVLVEDSRVRAISFTGSTAVGRKILERAAKHLARTQLELGGKNALIVMNDADMDAALGAAMTAGCACAGQWCTSTSRILVQREIYDEYCSRLAQAAGAIRLGDPLDDATGMGPVAGPEQFNGISNAIDIARQEGARMLTGGVDETEAGRAGYFIRPTLFADVTPSMTLFREEVFGPVLALTPFRDLDEGLRLANDSVYGLSSAIFTRDIETAGRYIRGIEAGMAHVNIHTGFKDPALPFGGWKESGYGPPENGLAGLEFFVERKAVYIRNPGC